MDATQLNRIEEYCERVCSQVKFREVHQEIDRELKSHLFEIVEEYLAEGFSENEALDKAITQMGSADLVGRQLNEVHNPKQEWSILVLSLLLIGFSLFTMYFIDKQEILTIATIPIFTRSLVFTIIGAVVATGLYLLDYRKLKPFSKYLYLGTALVLVIVFAFGQGVNGKFYLGLGPISFDIIEASPLLFTIALAGIIKKWDWKQPKKLVQNVLLCVIPLVLILESGSFSASVIYAITCIALMIVNGIRPQNFIFLFGLLSGIIMLLIRVSQGPLNSGWLSLQLNELIKSTGLYGQGLTIKPSLMPELHTDFVFTYITSNFGWIAAGTLVALTVALIIRMARIIPVVKDDYAKMLSTGFVTIFSVQFLWNILINFGFAPISEVGMRLISFGGSQLIISVATIGIILSIYKLKSVVTLKN